MFHLPVDKDEITGKLIEDEDVPNQVSWERLDLPNQKKFDSTFFLIISIKLQLAKSL